MMEAWFSESEKMASFSSRRASKIPAITSIPSENNFRYIDNIESKEHE